MKFDTITEFIDYICNPKNTDNFIHIYEYSVEHYNSNQFWDKISMSIICSDESVIYKIIDMILKSDNMKLITYTLNRTSVDVSIVFNMKDALKR